jgi:hypothetical protein
VFKCNLFFLDRLKNWTHVRIDCLHRRSWCEMSSIERAPNVTFYIAATEIKQSGMRSHKRTDVKRFVVWCLGFALSGDSLRVGPSHCNGSRSNSDNYRHWCDDLTFFINCDAVSRDRALKPDYRPKTLVLSTCLSTKYDVATGTRRGAISVTFVGDYYTVRKGNDGKAG